MRGNPKIMPLESLAARLEAIRARDRIKIVLCHGVFDLMHIGHIRHFEQAKSFGDLLVVTVTPDHYVNKGPHRPVFNHDLRSEAIAALDCVDYVAVNNWPTAIETIALLKPDIYVKGSEYIRPENDVTGKILLEKQAVEEVGGRLEFTDDITFSSSTLINQFMPPFAPEVTRYLAEFKQAYSLNEVLAYLENVRSLKVLLVGETIIDEYHYCEIMGKSGKEPILAARYISEEKSLGGVLAAANQAAAFCDKVAVLSCLGTVDSQEEFISSKLNPSIETHFLRIDKAPTIVKRRFVEIYPFQKVFEVYIIDDEALANSQKEILCPKLEELVGKYDLVIVTDYGHGMIGPDAVNALCQNAKFLAVNTQANAHNHGFNTISKYHRVDYICISERELRMEVRSRNRKISDVVNDVGLRLNCQKILVTRGRSGCLAYGAGEGTYEICAFTNRIVDRVGAGDAVLAVTSLPAALNAPMELVGFIANVVGAQAVNIIGNQSIIEKEVLTKHIISLLK